MLFKSLPFFFDSPHCHMSTFFSIFSSTALVRFCSPCVTVPVIILASLCPPQSASLSPCWVLLQMIIFCSQLSSVSFTGNREKEILIKACRNYRDKVGSVNNKKILSVSKTGSFHVLWKYHLGFTGFPCEISSTHLCTNTLLFVLL